MASCPVEIRLVCQEQASPGVNSCEKSESCLSGSPALCLTMCSLVVCLTCVMQPEIPVQDAGVMLSGSSAAKIMNPINLFRKCSASGKGLIQEISVQKEIIATLAPEQKLCALMMNSHMSER